MSEAAYTIEISAGGRPLVDLSGLTLKEGGITFLLGESGIGKSLAARAIFGLLDPDEFSVTINGMGYRQYLDEVRPMQRAGFFVFQEPSTHLNPMMTVGEQLEEGDLAWGRGAAESLGELWRREAAHDVAVINRLYPQPHRPSGGEKQRVLLAMALRKMDLAPERKHGIFIFDEPTGSLDNPYRDLFVKSLLTRYRRQPRTILFITHDYSLLSHLLAEYRDLLKVMNFREIVWSDRRLSVRDFHPGEYVDWVSSLQKTRVRSGSAEKPLLFLDSSLRILGRELKITSDAEGREETPLEVMPGRMVYLKAPSGTGKTSVAKAVMGLLPAERMRATVAGRMLTESTPRHAWQSLWGKAMTMVFQHADEALNMNTSVGHTLAQLRVPGVEAALEMLFDAGSVPALMRRKVWMLSGGQKQRLNLVRGMMLGTDILFLDEPLNGLDFESSTRVVAVIREKLKEGRGVVVISHNEEIFDALVRQEDRYYLRAG